MDDVCIDCFPIILFDLALTTIIDKSGREYAPMLVDTLRMWTESNSIVLIERKERSSHGSTCKKKEKSFQSRLG